MASRLETSINQRQPMAQETLSDALPHSEEAERSVLGAILVDNDQFERAREILTPDCFYAPRNQQIFEVLQKLVEAPDAEVLLEISDTKIRATLDGVVLTSKLIDGTFPDYARVIPQGNDIPHLPISKKAIRARPWRMGLKFLWN